ncbi:hypothetical protein [Phytohalomonas tamaricis]|uniref:hypothetical protein n=1 Tax=Phytohalomonas tamaricis TaxID=2081032 RepID=UPI000D0B3337|nr:hypothetical protein [Phytohalomonas tamaricis]
MKGGHEIMLQEDELMRQRRNQERHQAMAPKSVSYRRYDVKATDTQQYAVESFGHLISHPASLSPTL